MKILVISAPPTHPTTAGNRSRVLSICDVLRDAGHEVHFAWIPYDGIDHDVMPEYFGGKFYALRSGVFGPHRITLRNIFRRILRRLGVERAYVWPLDSWYDDGFTEQLKEIHSRERFDAVIVNYVFYSKAFDAFESSTLKVLETHDRFSNRHKTYLQAKMKPEWFSTLPDQEAKGLKRADVVVAIQEDEAEYFKELAPETKFIVVRPFTDVDSAVNPTSESLAIVVGSSNSLNVMGVDYLLSEVVPLVRQRIPSFRVVLAGDVSSYYEGHEYVVNLGRVRDLRDAYKMAKVAINPVLSGTGFCIKSLEALAYGVPLIATDAGLRGMGAIHGEFLVRVPMNDPASFADGICNTLECPNRERLGQLAWQAARAWSQVQKQTLLDALENNDKKS